MKNKPDAQTTGLHFANYTEAYKNRYFPLPLVLGNLDPSLTLAIDTDGGQPILHIKAHDWLGISSYPFCPVIWGKVDTEDANGNPITVDMGFVCLEDIKAISNAVAKGYCMHPDTTIRAFFVMCQTSCTLSDQIQKIGAHGVPKDVRPDMSIARDAMTTEAMQALNRMLTLYKTAQKRP